MATHREPAAWRCAYRTCSTVITCADPIATASSAAFLGDRTLPGQLGEVSNSNERLIAWNRRPQVAAGFDVAKPPPMASSKKREPPDPR